ncbi:MAG: hypothetical protein IK093_00205 [Ruminiclostridium sp.]|nr:hypothetical protein [Ruminiclostridium sp.]
MSKIMDECLEEERFIVAVRIALKMLSKGKESVENIADITGLSLENVKELSKKVNTPA